MATALTELVQLLVGAIVDLAEGIASGVVAMVTGLFLKTDSTTGAVTGLSVVGGVIGIFGGIALAVGITRRVYQWIMSLGARK